MEPSVEELKENYKRLSDIQLTKLATQDAADLRPEAIEVMRAEIISRGLAADLLFGIEAQLTELSEDEINNYCELVRNQDCPICGGNSYKLNATITVTTIGVIIMSDYREQLVIACPDCLYEANRNALIISSVAGWWEFPKGIFRTIKAIKANNRLMAETKVFGPNATLLQFVKQSIGIIEANKNDAERMKVLVKYLR